MSNWTGKVTDAVRTGDGSTCGAETTFTDSVTNEEVKITMPLAQYKNAKAAWIAAKIANLDQCDIDMAAIRADIAAAG